MESIIKEALKTTTLQGTGQLGKGCINEGEVFLTDHGKVFMKKNNNKARAMFNGEFESLKTIHNTNIIKVPKPLLVVDNPRGGAVLVMEYLDFKTLDKEEALLGDKMARLHLRNLELADRIKITEQYVGTPEKNSHVSYISKFGFHVHTYCGYHLQNNSWCEEWPIFYGRKLEDQFNKIEIEYCDREALQLWSILKVKLPDFFKGMNIKPSLLHGDLWSCNVGETDTEPVILDAASFYGHHEYDLGVAGTFAGFGNLFWAGYHKLIPRTQGWEQRQKLYVLFFILNQWNHFGFKYRNRNRTIKLLKELIQ